MFHCFLTCLLYICWDKKPELCIGRTKALLYVIWYSSNLYLYLYMYLYIFYPIHVVIYWLFIFVLLLRCYLAFSQVEFHTFQTFIAFKTSPKAFLCQFPKFGYLPALHVIEDILRSLRCITDLSTVAYGCPRALWWTTLAPPQRVTEPAVTFCVFKFVLTWSWPIASDLKLWSPNYGYWIYFNSQNYASTKWIESIGQFKGIMSSYTLLAKFK